MRKSFSFALAVAIVSSTAAQALVGQVQSLVGQVAVDHATGEGFVPAQDPTVLGPGAQVQVGPESSAVLESFNPRCSITLAPNSVTEFTEKLCEPKPAVVVAGEPNYAVVAGGAAAGALVIGAVAFGAGGDSPGSP